MSQAVDELWRVVRHTPEVDPSRLASAVERAMAGDDLDYRSRLLIRDSVAALEGYWDETRFKAWLTRVDGAQLASLRATGEDPDEVGFPTLARRLMDEVTPKQLMEFLRELSDHVSEPTRLVVGGAAALILGGYLLRHTDDIDVVDEVPAALRVRHDVLSDMARRYALAVTHFQSHYLNAGWDTRVTSAGVFGNLHVYLVDPYDIFVSKLFSGRTKDRDDLRMLARRLERDVIVRRYRETAGTFRADAKLLEAARKNWFVVFGEPLPTDSGG